MSNTAKETPYAISPNGLRLHVGWDGACKAYTYYITDLIGDLMLAEAPTKHRHESIEPVRALGLTALRSLEGTHDHQHEGAFVRKVEYKKAKAAAFRKGGSYSKKFFETVSKARAQSDKEALRYCQSLTDASASTLPSTKPTTPAYPVPPGAAPATAVVQADAKPEPTPAEWARLYNNLKTLKDKAPHLWTPELAKQLAEAREKRIAPLPGAEWMKGKGPLHGKIPNLK